MPIIMNSSIAAHTPDHVPPRSFVCPHDRLVNVYMNQFFCPAAIEEQNYPLSELKEYYVPPDGDLQSYKVRPGFVWSLFFAFTLTETLRLLGQC